jgi:hypothetical protein
MSVGQCGACGKPVAPILPVCPHCGARRSTDAAETSPAGVDATAPTPPITATSGASKPDPAIADSPAGPEWSAPTPSGWNLTPVHGLVALGVVVVLGVLWYGIATHRPATTRGAPGAVARAPETGHAPASSPPATVAPDAVVAPAATGPAAAPPDLTKFETADRAGKALEGAVTAGISYKDFEGRVEAFANELLVAKDRVRISTAASSGRSRTTRRSSMAGRPRPIATRSSSSWWRVTSSRSSSATGCRLDRLPTGRSSRALRSSSCG